jgi:surface polysaccharide O-acyltransferase-like enzyme
MTLQLISYVSAAILCITSLSVVVLQFMHRDAVDLLGNSTAAEIILSLVLSVLMIVESSLLSWFMWRIASLRPVDSKSELSAHALGR